MSVASAKVPAIVASSLICLVLGVFIGAAGAGILKVFEPREFNKEPPATQEEAMREAAAKGPGSGHPGVPGGMPMPGMGGGRGPGGGMGGGRGPGGGGGAQSKRQLAQLVTKLDLLTAKPLSVTLTEEQRAEVKKQLEGLGEMEDLSDEEAKNRLDALLKVVEKDRATLEAAGYRWPGAGGGGPGGGMGGFGPPPPNPFKEGDDAKALQSLQKQLTKGKG
jgi:hypothetical protein